MCVCLFTWPHGSSLTTCSDVGEPSGLLGGLVDTLSLLDGGVLSNCRPAGIIFGCSSIIDCASEGESSESKLRTFLVRLTLPPFELI